MIFLEGTEGMARIIEESAYRECTCIFKDRFEAGKLLAEKLRKYAGKANVILLAVPAGGVPVGYVIAEELGIPMEVAIVRKVQIPWNTEAGFGALAWDGETVLNEHLTRDLGLTERIIEESISKTRAIIHDRLRKFRRGKPLPNLRGKTVVLTDDGLASGFTMLAAVRSVKKMKVETIVVAVPTASVGAIKLVSAEVDEIVCLNIRSGPTFAVADAYKNWYDLTDEDVIEILEKSQSK
jgi:predicted phosphoribosyltransferase